MACSNFSTNRNWSGGGGPDAPGGAESRHIAQGDIALELHPELSASYTTCQSLRSVSKYFNSGAAISVFSPSRQTIYKVQGSVWTQGEADWSGNGQSHQGTQSMNAYWLKVLECNSCSDRQGSWGILWRAQSALRTH